MGLSEHEAGHIAPWKIKGTYLVEVRVIRRLSGKLLQKLNVSDVQELQNGRLAMLAFAGDQLRSWVKTQVVRLLIAALCLSSETPVCACMAQK